MEKIATDLDPQYHKLLALIASAGVDNAARGMSGMVGEELSFSDPVVRSVPFTEIPNLLGGPEVEAVGIYLRATGRLSAQIMMIVPYPEALELTDLVMCRPPGSTQSLGSMERSALAELGNLTGSFFLNAVANALGWEARPSPPAVMVDMVGAILDIIIATTDGLSESVPMIQATFMRGGREAQADFWVIPDRSTLYALASLDEQRHDQ